MTDMQNIQNMATQLAKFRRERGATQEDVARALGITNQAVSKWESGASCPDIGLLPDIAAYFGVSIDELFSGKSAGTKEQLGRKIRAAFEDCPAEEVFALAYRLCFLLHEGLSTHGYRDKLHWNERTWYDDETARNWGASIDVEREGATMMLRGLALFTDASVLPAITPQKLRAIHAALEPLADRTVLAALYALSGMEEFATADEIAAAACISAEDALRAFQHLPLDVREENGVAFYRLEGGYRIVPHVLTALAPV